MRLQDIPMRRKLVGSFLLVGCVPAVLLTLIGLLVAGTSLTTQTFQQLTGLREQKQQQLENYFTQQLPDAVSTPYQDITSFLLTTSRFARSKSASMTCPEA